MAHSVAGFMPNAPASGSLKSRGGLTKRVLTAIHALGLVVLLSMLISPKAFGQAIYEPDCNDPDAHDHACTEPTKAIINSLEAAGYPYYIGHAEPTTLFFSNAGASGNNMQWKFKLPATDPAPNQSGTSVANFELDITHWIGLALCDPNSRPYGPCTALSDSNNSSTAGAGFLELQFYPPGLNCSNSQWCVNLHINTLQDNNATQIMNCNEPTTAAYVTTDGTTGGTKLLMNNGDTIIVTLQDTANGLRTFVNDVTTGTTGFMVASGANGFKHNANLTDCTTTAFDFHPMFATAAVGQGVAWASLFPNVSFDFEIGHWELCSDTACSSPPSEPNGPGGSIVVDTGCQTIRGVGGCLDSELDHDGTSYLADWPDGTAGHPASIIIGAPNDKGVGPLSAQTSSSSTYTQGYKTIKFETTEGTNGAFYPFYSQAGTGTACVFNFGNDIPGTTTNDFGQATQFGGLAFTNPCFPAAAAAPTFSKGFAPSTIPVNTATTLTFNITNPDATTAMTGISFTDTLPAGLTVTGGSGTCGAGTVTAIGNFVGLTGGTLPAAGSCSFSVTVQATAAGVLVNTTGTITSDQSLNGSTATAALTVVGPPSISKAFGAPTVPINQNTTLTFTILNPNTTITLHGVGFTDTLPAGLVLAATPTSVGCGAPAFTGGPASINVTGATITPLGTCVISATITATTAGVKNNVTSNVTSTEGGSGNQATATITVVLPPSITKSFPAGISSIPLGGTVALTFTITNPNVTVTLATIAFTDTLPSILQVANPNGATGSCGGTLTAVPASGTIMLVGGTLAPTASCTFSVNVVGIGDGTAVNSVTVTSVEGGTGNTSTASITVGGFWLRYSANLTSGDSVIDITNTGVNGAQLNGPGFGAAGNLCVNVYTFSPDEQLVSCCSCLVTPNGLAALSVDSDLINNTLTGVRPNSLVVKLVATAAGPTFTGTSCTNSASLAGSPVFPLAGGVRAWGTTIHATLAGSFNMTETPFSDGTLSTAELASITNRCTQIIGNGSSFGICNSCRTGGLGASALR